MYRRFVLPVALTLLVLAATPALAIDGGVPDGNRHPFVGLLAFDIDGPGGPTPPFAICSGSVISDRAFLTAAHCIVNDIVRLFGNVTWAVTLAGGSPSVRVMAGGFFPADYPGCCLLTDDSQLNRAVGVVVDPLFDESTFTGPAGGKHDLAVVEFAPRTFANVTPVAIVHAGQLDALGAAGARQGPQLTVVGYGTEITDGQSYIPGYRKMGRATFSGLTDNWLELSETADARPRSAAPCEGDSGGPLFLGGSNVQVSVFHTFSGPPCSGVGYSQRLDTSPEQSFLAPFIAVQ